MHSADDEARHQPAQVHEVVDEGREADADLLGVGAGVIGLWSCVGLELVLVLELLLVLELELGVRAGAGAGAGAGVRAEIRFL